MTSNLSFIPTLAFFFFFFVLYSFCFFCYLFDLHCKAHLCVVCVYINIKENQHTNLIFLLIESFLKLSCSLPALTSDVRQKDTRNADRRCMGTYFMYFSILQSLNKLFLSEKESLVYDVHKPSNIIHLHKGEDETKYTYTIAIAHTHYVMEQSDYEIGIWFSTKWDRANLHFKSHRQKKMLHIKCVHGTEITRWEHWWWWWWRRIDDCNCIFFSIFGYFYLILFS